MRVNHSTFRARSSPTIHLRRLYHLQGWWLPRKVIHSQLKVKVMAHRKLVCIQLTACSQIQSVVSIKTMKMLIWLILTRLGVLYLIKNPTSIHLSDMRSSTNSPGLECHNGRCQVHPIHTMEGGTITRWRPIPLLIHHPTIHPTMDLTWRALPKSHQLCCCNHRTIMWDIQISVPSMPLSLVGLIIILVVLVLEVMKNLMATLPHSDELAPSPSQMLLWPIWPHMHFHHPLVPVTPQWRCLLVSNGVAKASASAWLLISHHISIVSTCCMIALCS